MLRKLAILFLTSAMMAQTAPTTPAKKPAAKKPATTAPSKPGAPGPLTDDTPVLWITGLCSIPATAAVPASPVPPKPGAPPEAKCMRQITKKQFETMSKVFPPGTDKMEVAEVYAQALAIENHSRAVNVEADQEARDVLWLARIKKLADLMHEQFQKQFPISDADVQAYYDQHKADFDEVTVEGVIVPKPQQKAAAVTTPGKDEKAPESPSASKAATPAAPEPPYAEKLAASKAAAEKMIARAKAGEDLAKLQKEAFTTAGIQEAPPDIEPFTIRHSQLRPQQEATGKKIFALEPGQYTDLIEEPSAYTFYKLVSKRTLSAADVKNEIKQKLTAQKEQAAIDEMLSKSKPVVNPAYFPPPKPGQGANPEGAAPQAAPEQPQAAPDQPKAEQPQQAPPKQEQSSEPPK